MSRARPNTVQAAFETASSTLESNQIRTPELDASLLLEAAIGVTTLQRITHPDRQVSDTNWNKLAELTNRRANHEPLHRIIGFREFYGLTLQLNEATLVPRPDTEILVDTVLPFAKRCVQDVGTCKILDLGTGTGAIALAILSQVPDTHAVATDISTKALEMVDKNAATHGLSDRLQTVHSNWFDTVSGSFDLIVSNPPYIASNIIASLDKEVRDHDPVLALDGGVDGLNAYELIAATCQSFLNKDGRIAVEIGFDQKNAVTTLFEAAGMRIIEAVDDLSGQNRVLFFAKQIKKCQK